MANRPRGSLSESHTNSPPRISLKDRLLASTISLPDEPHIVYSLHSPTSPSSQDHKYVELARRQLLARDTLSPLLGSLLPSVHITNESANLYVFAITSHDRIGDCRATLNGLHYEGLSGSEVLSFTPKDLYPCSLACSAELLPCSTCVGHQSPASTQHAPPPLSSTLLPRIPLRLVYSHFLEAVRSRIIDEICESCKREPNSRPIQRLKGGFLIHPLSANSEWGADWSHHALTRPLILCDLQIHLSCTRLTIHPILRPTPYLPLSLCLPLSPGTPITLLPHSTPAYYLANYAGPASTLTEQFDESLAGMGAGEWKTSWRRSGQRKMDHVDWARRDPVFIVAWINVQNKQGEDKGVAVIWPMRLCLSFIPGHAKSKHLLNYIPELPVQLQSSVLATVPVSSQLNSQGHDSTSPGRSLFARSLTRRAYSSPPSDSLRTIRTLLLGKGKDMNGVAMEVGGYVDAVAREREKERERMKREREIANSPKLAAVKTPGRIPSDNQAPGPSTTPRSPSQPQAAAVPTPAPHPSQHFYPSPPQSNPPPSAPPTGNAPTSPEVESSPIADPEPATNEDRPAPADEPPETVQPSASFDPSVDGYWAQPQNNEDFMDMGMDFNMGFVDNNGGGGGAYGRVTMDFDDAFTEDDFDFFDRPSASASKAVPIPNATIKMEGLTPAAVPVPLGMDMSPPLFSDGLQLSGPGPPHQSPWTMGSLGEGFTPRFADHHHSGENIPPTPQLLPPSPGPTPPSHSSPTTPNVKFAHSREVTIRNGLGTSIFEPIPFDLSHRIADGKYAVGKFALPSPPDEEDRTEPMFFPMKNGWRCNYDAATDHRIGMVRKLIGVKRKSFDQGTRRTKMSPSWVREHEDWECGVGKMTVDKDAMKDDESEDDDAEADSPMFSRPSTPMASYVPLGPTLLHTHFHHSHLLPLSSPLRPPGTAVTSTTTAPPTNVPTPVSPAAMIGAASEKSKSLEAAAYTVAKEVVENAVWADAWRPDTGDNGGTLDSEIWQSDVKTVTQLLDRVHGLDCGVDLGHLFQLDESAPGSLLQELECPMLSIAKSDAIIQVLPTALRFWEKLGLGPRGGRKDVTAFALFEDIGEERQIQVETWLSNISAMYTARHLGSHRAGASSSCTKDGLVPVRFDSFRKTLISFVASLPLPPSSLVFYIITPHQTMSLTSPILRQVFSAVKRAVKTYSEGQIHLQLVPEQVVTGSFDNAVIGNSDLETLCYSVYDRILHPVDRSMSRRFFEHGEQTKGYIKEPRFVLARPIYSKVKYMREMPIKSLDVIDRYTLLHVGYQISPCGKWLLAACVDQRAEAHELGVWLMQNDGSEGHTFAVSKVWEFVVQFAKKANVEWRIVIGKLGPMSGTDLDSWISHLTNAVPNCQEIPVMHVSLLSVEHDVPWTIITPDETPKQHSSIQNRSSTKEVPLFIDISASTWAMYPTAPHPLSSPTPNINTELTYIPDPTESHLPPTPSSPPLLPISSTALIRTSSTSCTPTMLHLHVLYTLKSPSSSLSIPDIDTHKDITRNYHELAVISSIRWKLGAGGREGLPFHLAAVEAMREALDTGEAGFE